jgi:hypothetical protein
VQTPVGMAALAADETVAVAVRHGLRRVWD